MRGGCSQSQSLGNLLCINQIAIYGSRVFGGRGGGRSRDSGNEKASYGTGANDVPDLPAVSILRRRIGLIMQLSSKAIVEGDRSERSLRG